MRKTIVALTMVLGLASAACGGSEAAKRGGAPVVEDEAETELTVVASDFGFDLGGVESVAPGEIQLTLENEGKQSHEAQLYLLNEGVTFEQFAEAAMEGETTRLPAEALAMATPGRGVTSNVDPGESITVPAPVEAGSYAFVCHILDSKSLSPHYALGMMAPLEVG
jgi:plastocyanin